MQKYVELQSLGTKLNVISAFVVERVRGFIYIEAERQFDIVEVIFFFFFLMRSILLSYEYNVFVVYEYYYFYWQWLVAKLMHKEITIKFRHAKGFLVYIRAAQRLSQRKKFLVCSPCKANATMFQWARGSV